VIPIAVIFGLVVGRWWALAAAALGWAVILVATGTTGFDGAMALGAGLALANAAVGVLVHKACAAVFRAARSLVSN
jgi:hypothetical protein